MFPTQTVHHAAFSQDQFSFAPAYAMPFVYHIMHVPVLHGCVQHVLV
jgi:hypothetical protein